MVNDMAKLWEAVIAVLLATMGGLARLLSKKDNEDFSWPRLLSELFIAGFAGIMVLMAMRAMDISGDWVGLVCGMAGWIGPKVLDNVAEQAERATGIRMNAKSSGRDEE
ncbi:MAG: phage holin family protein [Symbiobacteriaceae bacterium]|nr:phage holin family protein [Symbiobacteriaceae bacterium]